MNWDISYQDLIVARDSVGGNMATVMTLLSKYQHGPKISKQLLYYSVTNDNFYTDSYNQFAKGYYLSREAMEWFWNQYTSNMNDRHPSTCPLKAAKNQLEGLPDAMILNGEADVLRDEGNSYATKLMEAGVNVTQIRFKGIIHDFVMLNSLNQTNACRAAMNISTSRINHKKGNWFVRKS